MFLQLLNIILINAKAAKVKSVASINFISLKKYSYLYILKIYRKKILQIKVCNHLNLITAMKTA